MDLVLSIITVASNDNERLRKTIESIDYSIPSFEHIFVIPAGEIDALVLIQDLTGRHPNISLANDQGRGIYDAMNVGSKCASGSFLVFWNAGETLISAQALSSLIRFLKVCPSPAAIFGWVGQNGLCIPSPVLARKFLANSPDGFISHQAVALSQGVFSNYGGFDSKLRVAADTKLLRRVLRKESVAYFAESVIKVEDPKYSSLNHRRGRFEFFQLLITSIMHPTSLIALWNFLKGEYKSYFRR
jgi:hypothetical protein